MDWKAGRLIGVVTFEATVILTMTFCELAVHPGPAMKNEQPGAAGRAAGGGGNGAAYAWVSVNVAGMQRAVVTTTPESVPAR